IGALSLDVVRLQPAWDEDGRAAHRELCGLTACVGAEGDRRRRLRRVDHLRGDSALPDELVELERVAAQLAREARRRAEGLAGRADRLVRLLRILARRRVQARLVGD